MRRVAEGSAELLAPVGLAGLAWGLSVVYLAAPTPAVGVTHLELAALFGANAALTGWAGGRVMYLMRRRHPRWAVGASWALCVVMLLLLPRLSADRFAARCAEAWGGAVVSARVSAARPAPESRPVCKVGGVVGSPYLTGRLLRPRGSGPLNLWVWPGLLAIAGLAALGWRDRCLVPTAIGERVLRGLPYAAAGGWAASPRGGPSRSDKIEACANVTWWGELCGQVYPGDKAPAPGGACVRCHQGFRPAARRLTLRVVSLVSADADELNALEKQDMVSWTPADGPRDELGASGRPRWAVLGQVELPDVLTVAQALALVHARLPGWAEAPGSPERARAIKLAQGRASLVSAWLWAGAHETRLNRARPEREATLAVGPQRLRDLNPRRGGALWLQLDVGLMPLELWEGRQRPSAGPANLRSALWIPVAAPRRPAQTPGLWVPRVEGDALRAWLRVSRRRASPDQDQLAPYQPKGAPPGLRGQGPLDLVIRPIDPKSREPSAQPQPGESIAEWLWLERAQIQLLRRSALVMVER